MRHQKKVRYDTRIRSANTFVFASIIFALLLLLAFSGTRQPFSSAEVKFSDISASGLAIMPASCPSAPENPDYPHDTCSSTFVATCVGSPPTISSGDQVVWGAQASGGTPPYTRFVWSDSEGREGDTGSVSNWGPIGYSTPGTVQGNVIVVDSMGATASASCSVTVQSNINGPALSINKVLLYRSEGDTVASNDILTYRMYISNSGTTDQNWLDVHDHIPTNTKLFWQGGGTDYNSSGQIAGGVDGNGDIWWQQQYAPAGWSGYVDFSVQVDANAPEGAQICNTARISSQEVSVQNSNTVCNPVSDINGPDLTPVSLVPNQVTVNVATEFTGTMENTGNEDTPDFHSTVYVCQKDDTACMGAVASQSAWDQVMAFLQPTAHAAEAILINLTGPSIAAGAEGEQKGTQTFTEEGEYMMRLCADLPDNDVDETNEANNCGDWTLLVVGPAGDGCTLSASRSSLKKPGTVTLTGSIDAWLITDWTGTLTDIGTVGDSNPGPWSVWVDADASFTLEGSYTWLGLPIDTFLCSTSVDVLDDDDEDDTLCGDGSLPPGGDLSRCPTTCTESGSYPRCSDATHIEYLDPDSCTPNVRLCEYAKYDYGCIGADGDAVCTTPPPPSATFDVNPTLVRAGTRVHVVATAEHVDTCDITSSATPADGRHLPGSRGNSWQVSADYQSSPIQGQTIFSLHCDGLLRNTAIDESITVNLVPKFEEPPPR